MKIVRHHANSRFDWLISGNHSVNLSREAISLLSGKYKRFTFVYPVGKIEFLIEDDKKEFESCIIALYIEEIPDVNISATSNELSFHRS